jgi:hypothetical protein
MYWFLQSVISYGFGHGNSRSPSTNVELRENMKKFGKLNELLLHLVLWLKVGWYVVLKK